ncbi:MAG: hypothetical protein R2708_18540 [Vicinamibacterales bacterium]
MTRQVLRLKKGEPGRVISPDPVRGTNDDAGQHRIRCPKCQWQPDREARWSCSCRHEWHTFDTGGVCPACGQVWADTQCLRCEQWSPHLAWYDTEGADRAH